MIVIKKICQLKIVYHLLISSNITSPTSTRIVTFSKLQILDKYLYKIEIRLRTTRRCQGKRAKLQMGVSRKQSPPNFLKNEHFLPPDTVRFSENLTCFVSLKHPSRDYPFCLIVDVLCRARSRVKINA